MLDAEECRSKARRHARLAQTAESEDDQRRHRRMQRSYELMARCSDYGASLDALLDPGLRG